MSTISWTSPRTWVLAEFVTAALLNTHLRDNLNFLKSNPVIAEGTWTGGNVQDGAVVTLASVSIPSDVGAVYVEAWAIQMQMNSPTVYGGLNNVYATISESTAGNLGAVAAGSYGVTPASIVAPVYMRSRDLAWAGTTRTVTFAVGGGNANGLVYGDATYPAVLRIVRAY